MAVSMDAVQAALKTLIDPNTQKDYVSARAVKNLRLEGDVVVVDIELGYPAKTQFAKIRASVEQAVAAVPGVSRVEVGVSSKIVAHAV